MNVKQLNDFKMKTNIKNIAIIFILAIVSVLSACEPKEEGIAKPEITITELGLSNSHVAYIGADLHIEAEIVAEGKIEKIEVEIHQEEGSSEEIYALYEEFSGLKNTTFHKHIEIPAETAAGTYHFHFIVTDMEGNQTVVENEISIQELVDVDAPVLNITSAPLNGANYTNGENITIAGSISDNASLGGMLVALVYESDNIADADVIAGNTSVIIMLHSHTFDSPESHSFSASIAVGAAYDNNTTPAPIDGANAWKNGNYYVMVKCTDAKGNWAYSSHYQVVIK